jgi:hypothetical protein
VRKFIDKYLHWVLLFLICILLITLSILSEGYYGGADNIVHYTFSRFGYKYPHLFLDLWGRPLFTILSSPFSQFGFNGIKIFNILTGLFTAYLSFLIAKKLKLSPSFLVILFVCFTPLYCIMLMTGLTETLFSFVLVLAIYYFFDEKYIVSSIVISFLLFARTEGFIFLPLFFLAFLAKRKFKAIPFLATGFVFFSLVGSFYYRDLLWIIHNFPYSAHNPSYYKSGSFFHFFDLHDKIVGIPLEIMAGIGVLYLLTRIFTKDSEQRSQAFYEIVLILGPFLLYLTFHSVLYWKGLGGSLGLERVIAAVLPLAAILAMRGYHLVNKFIPDLLMKTIILIAFVFLLIQANFKMYDYPVQLDGEEKLEKQASLWFEQSGYTKAKLYFTDYNACFFLDTRPEVDLISLTGLEQLHSLDDIKTIKPGSVVQWDAHFGANELRMPRDSLMRSPRLKLLNYLQPDEPMHVLGKNLAEVLFFVVLPDNKKADNYFLYDSITSVKDNAYKHKTLQEYTFEGAPPGIDPKKISVDTAYSGAHSFRMDKNTDYGPVIETKWTAISTLMKEVLIRATTFVLFTAPLQSDKVYLVVSLEENNAPYQYQTLLLNELNLKVNEWNKVSLTVHLHTIKSPEDHVKVYLWNEGKVKVYFDDFKVEALIPLTAKISH